MVQSHQRRYDLKTNKLELGSHLSKLLFCQRADDNNSSLHFGINYGLFEITEVIPELTTKVKD